MKSTSVIDATIYPTRFAEAYREPREKVLTQYNNLMHSADIRAVLDAVPYMTLILNRFRQVVYCNEALLAMLSISEMKHCIGMRPGEILHCIHADTEPYGCGTAENCEVCGAVNAVLECLETGKPAQREARILVKKGAQTRWLDLEVAARPISFENNSFVIATVTDISDSKRRAALERIFLHDIANIVGGIVGLSELLQLKNSRKDILLDLDLLNRATTQLFHELRSQQELLRAENNELTVERSHINSYEIMEEVAALFSGTRSSGNVRVVVNHGFPVVDFQSDHTLLFRILCNMVKNGIEASSVNEQVTISSASGDNNVLFIVHNRAGIPKEVQLQIFQRSFSTRGKGRGLGTYSAKLLAERYLEGKVFFKSNDIEGTTFYASFPLQLSGRTPEVECLNEETVVYA